MRRFWFFKVFVSIVGFVLLGGFVVMSLWNWLIPGIFGLGVITFVQALGLLVLSKILFGGFRGGHWGGGCGGGHQFWKHRMAERWDKMTAEERNEFKQKMRGRWGRWNERREDKEFES
jgi:hypothetical protein